MYTYIYAIPQRRYMYIYICIYICIYIYVHVYICKTRETLALKSKPRQPQVVKTWRLRALRYERQSAATLFTTVFTTAPSSKDMAAVGIASRTPICRRARPPSHHHPVCQKGVQEYINV